MSNKILYNDAGTVGIVSIAQGFSVEDCKPLLPTGCTYAVVSEEDISNTEYFDDFFEAIIVNADQIEFDINRARELTKTRLRQERVPLFEPVDLAIRDAMIENDQEKLKAAIAERDRLRDLTELVYTATTVKELRNLTA